MSKIPLSEFLNVDFVFVETGETAESAIKKLEKDLRKGNSGNTLYAISTSNPQLQGLHFLALSSPVQQGTKKYLQIEHEPGLAKDVIKVTYLDVFSYVKSHHVNKTD